MRVGSARKHHQSCHQLLVYFYTTIYFYTHAFISTLNNSMSAESFLK